MISQQKVLHKKRECFHREIRRQNLENYFHKKRVLLLDEEINNTQRTHMQKYHTQKNVPETHKESHKHRSLNEVLEDILQGKNLRQNTVSLTNLLAADNPFKNLSSLENKNQNLTESDISAEQVHRFCDKMAAGLLQIAMEASDQKIKLTCYSAVSNMFSDSACDNSRYVRLIAHFIETVYGSIRQWGVDKETEEISFMVSALLGQNILSASHHDLEKLLQWVEQTIEMIDGNFSDPDTIVRMFAAVQVFFANVDEVYSANCNHQYVESFLSNRQIIIDSCISIFKHTNGSKIQAQILRFLLQNSAYIHRSLGQNQKLAEKFIRNMLLGLHLTSSLRQNEMTMKLIISLVSRQPHHEFHQSEMHPPKKFESEDSIEEMQNLEESRLFFKKYIIQYSVSKFVEIMVAQQRSIKLLCLRLFDELLQEIPCMVTGELQQIGGNRSQSHVFDLILTGLKGMLVECGLELGLVSVISLYSRDYEILMQVLSIEDKIVEMSQGLLGRRIHKKLEDCDQELRESDKISELNEQFEVEVAQLSKKLSCFMTEQGNQPESDELEI